MPGKPQKTAADYMVIALSPALIMALVGSLCFFLVEIFYQGRMQGVVRWVLFWFVVAIVLISRIAIETSPEKAALYGMALGATVWLYMVRTEAGYLLGIVLLAAVWFCAHKLVWDCTLIDEDEDASGEGLLQRRAPAPISPPAKGKPKKKAVASGLPGRWVIYFSLAALPLFGIGQVLLPADASGSRRWGLAFVVLYMAAALGLLITTSFLGLRRYLRQRYLRMPPSIALAWLKLGAGVALIILAGALFLPRPGANVAWRVARQQVNERLLQASQYAARSNPHGEGQGRAGNENGPAQKEGGGAKDRTPGKTPASQSGGQATPPSAPAVPMPEATGAYLFLRAVFAIAAVLLAGWWLFRCRFLLWEMFRSALAALQDFFRRLLDLIPARKPVRPPGPEFSPRPRRSLSEFKNPFFAGKGYAMPPAQIILYTYDAVQAWAAEQGMEAHPEWTGREFCREMASRLPELASPFRQLSFLHAHAAYGERLPASCDLEPLKEIWRRLTWSPAATGS
ncbi:MAG: DUF4129 domain-containing protein [Verrucomicrobiota bacterium]|jgi:hypothetical protein